MLCNKWTFVIQCLLSLVIYLQISSSLPYFTIYSWFHHFITDNSSPPTHKSLISEEAEQQLAQQAVVKLVASAEFEGFEEKPLQMLVDLMKCHIRKLGNGLRFIVDTYKNECSQAEILNLYIHGASGR